jgi:hypothetical protein
LTSSAPWSGAPNRIWLVGPCRLCYIYSGGGGGTRDEVDRSATRPTNTPTDLGSAQCQRDAPSPPPPPLARPHAVATMSRLASSTSNGEGKPIVPRSYLAMIYPRRSSNLNTTYLTLHFLYKNLKINHDIFFHVQVNLCQQLNVF